jgi:hypothetical protein
MGEPIDISILIGVTKGQGSVSQVWIAIFVIRAKSLDVMNKDMTGVNRHHQQLDRSQPSSSAVGNFVVQLIENRSNSYPP